MAENLTTVELEKSLDKFAAKLMRYIDKKNDELREEIHSIDTKYDKLSQLLMLS